MTLKLNGTTSGSVSIDAPATGSDISFTLPGSVGSSGQLLSTDGAGVLSFVNGGKILQVVRATDSSTRTTTSTSFVDASISVTITPQKSSSAVMLIWACSVNPDVDRRALLQITDNSNNAISGAQSHAVGKSTASGGQVYPVTLIAYATPNTTSAVTYKGRFATVTGGTAQLSNVDSTGQLYAIEVAA